MTRRSWRKNSAGVAGGLPRNSYGPHGGREGLDVGDDFFPLWELILPENQEALAQLDFAAIKARRGPDWSVDPPRYEA